MPYEGISKRSALMVASVTQTHDQAKKAKLNNTVDPNKDQAKSTYLNNDILDPRAFQSCEHKDDSSEKDLQSEYSTVPSLGTSVRSYLDRNGFPWSSMGSQEKCINWLSSDSGPLVDYSSSSEEEEVDTATNPFETPVESSRSMHAVVVSIPTNAENIANEYNVTQEGKDKIERNFNKYPKRKVAKTLQFGRDFSDDSISETNGDTVEIDTSDTARQKFSAFQNTVSIEKCEKTESSAVSDRGMDKSNKTLKDIKQNNSINIPGTSNTRFDELLPERNESTVIPSGTVVAVNIPEISRNTWIPMSDNFTISDIDTHTAIDGDIVPVEDPNIRSDSQLVSARNESSVIQSGTIVGMYIPEISRIPMNENFTTPDVDTHTAIDGCDIALVEDRNLSDSQILSEKNDSDNKSETSVNLEETMAASPRPLALQNTSAFHIPNSSQNCEVTDNSEESNNVHIDNISETSENTPHINGCTDVDTESSKSEVELDIGEDAAKKKKSYNPPEKRTRKRQRNPDKWKKTINSKAYRRGEAYVNSKGRLVPAKTMGPGCKTSCRFKCHSRVTLAQRTHIFKRFYDKNDSIEKVWAYMCCNVKKNLKTESTVGEHSRRSFSYEYFFRINNKDIKVCKTMFLSTHRMSNSTVETAFEKRGEGACISPKKKPPVVTSRSIPTELKKSVREHIEMYPKVESHFTRKDSNRQYIEHGLTVAEMHRQYVTWMMSKDGTAEPVSREEAEDNDDGGTSTQSEGEDSTTPSEDLRDDSEDEETTPLDIESVVKNHPHIASERQYRDIFNNEYDIGTHLPKKDQCDECTVYKNASPAEKLKLDDDLQEHLRKKDFIRDLKLSDKEATKDDLELAFVCFDLQKVLYVPLGNASLFYYNSKMSVFNFTVYHTVSGDFNVGHCYTWDQTVAKRGSNEISSCLLKYFEMAAGKGLKEFRMYSDNCIGQNKNRNVFALYVYAATKFGIKITHRFLLKGHTQNEGDSIHGRIETTSKGKKLVVPSHWRAVMRAGKVDNNPYVVVKMTQADFFDFKDLSAKQNWEKCENGMNIEWLRICQVQVEPPINNEPAQVKIKYSFDEEVSYVVPVNRRRARPVNLETYNLKPAYNGFIPLDSSTQKGLTTICKGKVIEEKYCRYYRALCRRV